MYFVSNMIPHSQILFLDIALILEVSHLFAHPLFHAHICITVDPVSADDPRDTLGSPEIRRYLLG